MSDQVFNFDYVQGNDIPLRVTVFKPDGSIDDISSASEIRFGLAETAEDPAPLWQKSKTGGEITWETDGTDGVFLVAMVKSETANLVGQKHFESDVLLATTETIVRGVMHVKPSVLN